MWMSQVYPAAYLKLFPRFQLYRLQVHRLGHEVLNVGF